MRLSELTEESIELFHKRFKNKVMYYTEEEHNFYLTENVKDLESTFKVIGLRLEGNQLVSSYPIIYELKMIIGLMPEVNVGGMLEFDLTNYTDRENAKDFISRYKSNYLNYVGSVDQWYKDKQDIKYILEVYDLLETLSKDKQRMLLELYSKDNTRSIKELLSIITKHTLE